MVLQGHEREAGADGATGSALVGRYGERDARPLPGDAGPVQAEAEGDRAVRTHAGKGGPVAGNVGGAIVAGGGRSVAPSIRKGERRGEGRPDSARVL